MMPIFVIAVLAALVWLLVKSQRTVERIENLTARCDRLEDELRRLRREETDAKTVAPVRAASVTLPIPAPRPMVPPVGEPPLVLAAQTGAAQPSGPLRPPLVPIAPKPVAAAQGASPPPLRPSPALPAINWEIFLGVKLFAWAGGLVLFLGVAFFITYSFEHNLISPAMRVAIGYVVGLWLPRERHMVTVQTLCATGTLILYANIFASHAYYKLIGATPAFAVMTLVTAVAFFLAVRLEAQVVAVLGLLGGFLTPPLLSTGVDHPLGLFGYVGLLDVGLLAVALRQRWNHLVTLAGVATVLMQTGWVMKFFAVEKIHTAMGIYLAFTVLFVAALVVAQRLAQADKWITASAILLPAAALAFALYVLWHPYPELAQRAVLLFSFVALVDVALLLMSWLRDDLRLAELGAGAAVFFLLSVWTVQHLTAERLNAALCFYLVFAVAHSVFPVVLQRLRPAATPLWWIHLYPPLALLLLMVPLFKIATALSFLFWPVILLIDLLAIALAVFTASLVSIFAVFALTVIATALWIFQLPPELPEAPGMLLVIGGFAVFFIAATILAARKVFAGLAPAGGGPAETAPGAIGSPPLTPQMFAELAALAAMLPFFLLTLVVLRLPLADPSAVFGLAALLLALLLGVLWFYEVDLLSAVGLGSVLLVEYAWHFHRFTPEHAGVAVSWYLGLGAALLAFPFVFQKRMEGRVVPWAAAALALPLHFTIVYRALKAAYPDYGYFGLLPAALAVPCLLGLVQLVRRVPAERPARKTVLAFFGGATLFFITLIFPIQFERQWITLGWALEGAALLWLFHRLPHPGLRVVGAALLAVSFARLALNPWGISEYGRSGRPILNWYLYAYGLATAALLLGGRLLAPPRQKIGPVNASAVLYSLGAVLGFLLVNVEIADYFSGQAERLVFNFSASFAQDMTYSLAWS